MAGQRLEPGHGKERAHLMRLRSRALLLCIALSLAMTVAVPPSAQGAEPPGKCTWNGFSYDCHTEINAPGSSGTATSTSSDLTPGPTTCARDGKTVPCSNKYGAYSDSGDCIGYVRLSPTQETPPLAQLDGSGAWYECTLDCIALQNPIGELCPGGVGALYFWSTTPPPGVDQYTPAQAAVALARSFRLTPITIGMAPASKVHDNDPPGTQPYRRTWVGIPVWLWVANPTPLTYGPYAQTATLGGVTVTARATVTQVIWTSGAGHDVTCGAGTPFDPSAWTDWAAEDSPTCGFRFQQTSTDEPDAVWNVTATSHWTVSWTGAGQKGTLQLTNLTAITPVQVGELQSVNLPITADRTGGQL